MSAIDIMQAPSQRPNFPRRLSLSLHAKARSVKQLLTPPSSQSASPASSRTPSSNSICVKNEPPTVFGSLEERYGKPGRILGDGATGTVRVFTHPIDGTVVAVKKFRSDRPEDEKNNAKKATAEFQIGTSLKHANIIKVLEIVKERGSWFQVLEFAPIELFEVAESRIMGVEEIYCTFGQVLEGVKYLHSMGIAHRDLKLENVVMTEEGIMKIIDFGNATVFRPLSTGTVVLARGYVGCEPYMAPEILMGNQYDPRAVDVWSLAILFCRLILSRFPWEIADNSDYSFRSFSTPSSCCASMAEYGSTSLTGPMTLLKDLPKDSQTTIRGMLQVSPGRRLSLRQVLNHPWVRNLRVCSQDSEGKLHPAEGHEHMAIPESMSPTKLTPTASRKDVTVDLTTIVAADVTGDVTEEE